MQAALKVHQVEKSFREGFWLKKTKILKGISLEVPQGAIFGFLGANGAGKTTLIHLIVGLRAPTAGVVQVCGHDSQSVEAKLKMGYLPERPFFHEHLTGDRLLRFYGALAGMKKSSILSRIPEVLAIVGMSHARHLELKKYSKGMLQRIGIAQALIHNPEILVFDEPMSGLDPIGRKEIRELILKLAREGKTMFFSSHVIPDVEAICDRVAVIHQGKLVESGPIGTLLEGRSKNTEIGFSGLKKVDPSLYPQLSNLTENQGGFRGLVSGQEQLDRTLAQLLKDRAQVLWVAPVRPSLEDFLMQDRSQG